MKVLITGGCGFLGSNLAEYALKNKYELFILDNLSRNGSISNLQWLYTLGNFTFLPRDIRNTNDVQRIIQEVNPDLIFHLAGQVAMTTSINNTRLDFETNLIGTFNLLEAVKQYAPNAVIIFSSTNKVYGDLEQFDYIETDTRYICQDMPNGFDENVALNFHSPYGVSKGGADQYMLDYHRIFGLKTVVFRHSSMYGGRQFATVDQGWIGWFCKQALNISKNILSDIIISGSGKQVRDVLHAQDMVNLYYRTFEHINTIQGHAFNIGGGIENSLSLLELFKHLEAKLSIKINIKHLPERISDQKIFIANNQKINNMISWNPKIDYILGIEKMLHWLK